MAALVTDFTREGIFEAIRARRTYALTGDRIEVDFRVDGEPMGSTIEAGRSVEVAFDVQGRDEIDVVEILQDGHVVHRAFADDQVDAERAFGGSLQVRLEWGWGPWGALALDRICDWAMRVDVEQGRILRLFPCLQSMPFDEQRRHRFTRAGDTGLDIRSYTARQNAYRENPNQSVVLELEGTPDTVLRLALAQPAQETTTTTLRELFAGSRNLFTGGFPQEGYQWHRLLPSAASAVRGRCTLPMPEGRSFVYLRARQKNGHVAWASPVFINYR
jgi:hypothetical protein